MAVTDPFADELARFEAGEIDPAGFSHREHVRMAFEMLRRSSFTDAAARFAAGLKRLVRRAGQAQAYHETMTVAFLALIAERMASSRGMTFEAFGAAHPELFDKALIGRWYAPEILNSAAARATFILPPPAHP
jgi:hypothetical protein